VDSFSSTGCANILTRESRMQAIHSSRVFGWVKQPGVDFVHAQAWEPSIGNAGAEDGAGVGVPLDCGDGGVAEDEIGIEAAAGAAEEMEGPHITPPPRR